MNHYENKIDPIGESFEREPETISPLDKLHEDIINKNTYIVSLKNEITNLDELVKGYETFSDDVYMIDNLKNLSQRFKNNLKSLELACEGINDFIESQLK